VARGTYTDNPRRVLIMGLFKARVDRSNILSSLSWKKLNQVNTAAARINALAEVRRHVEVQIASLLSYE
jgi:hypothetical protein